MENTIKQTKITNPRFRSRLIFYVLMLIWPVLQFTLFYFVVNFNGILLAFQKFTPNPDKTGYIITYTLTGNFEIIFNKILPEMGWQILNSVKFYAIDFPVALTLQLIFSYYIYKKYPGAGFFKVVLYLPSLISGLVLSILFKYLMDDGFREIMSLIHYGDAMAHKEKFVGLLYNPKTAMAMVIFFNIWCAFGVNILMYSGAMSSIDESIVESCHLDGCNLIQEFWHISVPMIFPTFISLTITSITGIFNNQMGLLSLYGEAVPREVERELRVIGYTMFLHSKNLGSIGNLKNGWITFTTGELSAYGLFISLIVIPIVFGVRHLLTKYGPSVD